MKKLLLSVMLCALCTSLFAVRFVTKPYLQCVQSTEATIMWLSDDNVGMYGWVEYIPSGGKKQIAYQCVDGVRSMCSKINRVRLTNLEPGKKYSYRVYEVGMANLARTSITVGDTIMSETYSFTTPALDAPYTRCLIFNDLHNNPSYFQRMIGFNKLPDYDFVYFNGDILNTLSNETTILENLIKPAITTFATEKPFFTVKGNHETFGSYIRHYWDYFANPTSASGEPRGFYSFSWGPCFFIVLDTGSDQDNTKGILGSLEDFDPYRVEQAAWLEKQLQSEERKKASFTFVMMHAPTYSNTSKEYHQSIHAREVFQPLFHQYEIDALICGHTHIPTIEPADSRHYYPQIIGGGYETTSTKAFPTMITLEATSFNAIISIYNFAGEKINSIELFSKNPPSLSGDLVVTRLGDGTKALNKGIAYPLFIDEYNLHDRTATLTKTIPLPTQKEGNHYRCVGVGNAVTPNMLTLSENQQVLLVCGYDDSIGGKSASKSAEEAPRVVAAINVEGEVNTTTALTNVYSCQEFRSVASQDGRILYLSGSGTPDNPGGIYTTSIGASSATPVLTDEEATKHIHFVDGDLWTVTSSDLLQNGKSFLPAGPTISETGDFVVVKWQNNPTKKILYWVTSPTEISKYSFVQGVWKYNGAINQISRSRSLIARSMNNTVQLFAITGINSALGSCKLVLLEDAGGYNAPYVGAVSELVDCSGTYTTLRGISWKPTNYSDFDNLKKADDNTKLVVLPTGIIGIQYQNKVYSITGTKIQ